MYLGLTSVEIETIYCLRSLLAEPYSVGAVVAVISPEQHYELGRWDASNSCSLMPVSWKGSTLVTIRKKQDIHFTTPLQSCYTGSRR